MKVLILDEHVSLGAELSDALRRSGFAPFYCKGGGAALTLLRLQPFGAVVLSDGLRRPSALEVAAEIHQCRPKARIVVLAEQVTGGIRARYAQFGISDYLGRAQVATALPALLRRPAVESKRPAAGRAHAAPYPVG